MLTVASDRLGSILALLLMALTGCVGQLFAAGCDQPLVSFRAGQLAISSNGCSLQQVLAAVGRQTGIETEVPASASATPVFASLGPGDPKQVVSALLDGAPFNWSLATEADGSGSLVRVVLTERSAPLELAKLSVGAAQPAPTLAANATADGKQMAGQTAPDNKQETTKDKDKREDANTQPSTFEDEQSDQPKRRAEIDDSTLSKLPPLPPGVPTGMWQLYPGLVANAGVVQDGPPLLPNGQPAPTGSPTVVANGGVVQDGPPLLPNGQPAPTGSPTAFEPSSGPNGCKACPVPPGVDPAIVNLYPWNLMQLIQMPITMPNIQLPPPPPWAKTNH